MPDAANAENNESTLEDDMPDVPLSNIVSFQYALDISINDM
jgi:hypothetical protein